ncbi:MAG: hypothetical protein ACM3QZ_12635 [Solirubrobacterales bacterium]
MPLSIDVLEVDEEMISSETNCASIQNKLSNRFGPAFTELLETLPEFHEAPYAEAEIIADVTQLLCSMVDYYREYHPAQQ